MSAQLTEERRERQPHEYYSPERKAEVLSLYDANNGNLKRTSLETGIDHSTIRYWVENQERYRELQPKQRLDLAERFKKNAHLALDLAETKASEASYAQLMTGAAIATDKMQLLNNLPTSITVNVERVELVGILQSALEAGLADAIDVSPEPERIE